MTDEPNQPIDQPTQPSEPVAPDSGAVPAERAPAGSPDSPIEPRATTESPADTPPELPVAHGQESESPRELAEAEAQREEQPAAEPAEADVPSEAPAEPSPAEAMAAEAQREEQPVAEPAEADVPSEAPAEPSPAEAMAAEPQPEEQPAAEPAEAVAVEAQPEEPPAAMAVQTGPGEDSAGVSREKPADRQASAAAERQKEAKEAKREEKEKEEKSDKMDWYILKVQSNREDSIREGLLRRVAIAGLGYYFGEVIVPMEQVTEFKGGKRRVTKRKLYPGYLVVQMEINDDTWFLVRETPGIGDFTGAAGHPTPMLPHEVARIVAKHEEKGVETPKLKIAFRPGDRVKINEGTFENFEGEVDTIDETNGRVTVMINIFGRSTPVELEYWQIESV